jgi:hypothetical protein
MLIISHALLLSLQGAVRVYSQILTFVPTGAGTGWGDMDRLLRILCIPPTLSPTPCDTSILYFLTDIPCYDEHGVLLLLPVVIFFSRFAVFLLPHLAA